MHGYYGRSEDPYQQTIVEKGDIEKYLTSGDPFKLYTLTATHGYLAMPQDLPGPSSKQFYHLTTHSDSSKESLYSSSRMVTDEDGDAVSVNNEGEVLDSVEDREDCTCTLAECRSGRRRW